MQWVQCGVSIAVAAGLLAATAPHARAQESGATGADTLVVGTAYRFAPVYKNNIDGGVSSVGMLNEFASSMTTPYGPILSLGLAKNETHYRLQDRREENKRLTLSGVYLLRNGISTTLSYSDSRVFNRSRVVGGSFQDFIINDNGFNGGINYKQAQGKVRYDAAANASAMNGERTYKNDETFGGGVNGGVAATILGDRVIVQARGALRETSETSRTTLSVFDGLGASEDSISSVVRVSLSDSISAGVSYASYNGVRDYADQLQGALGVQKPGEENVFPEHEERTTRSTAVYLSSHLWKGFTILLDASHDEQESDFEVQTTRYSRNVIDAVKGSVNYVMPWKTTAAVTFDNSDALRDFGPQSVASLNEGRKRASLGLGHAFSETFRMDLTGSTQLTQTFYVDYEANPRDRDQMDNIANFRITSTPFKNVSANIALAYASSRFLNIDASQSRNNRQREQFELRPGFSWSVRDWLTIAQTYGVVIEHTEYDYVPEDNFLDRNLVFTNLFVFRPGPGMQFRFDYGLFLHDKGSYLPTGPDGEEVLNVETEDRRNRLTLRLDYDINERIGIFAENRYNQFVDRAVSSGFETVSTDGLITVGAQGDYKWSQNRTFTFTLARVKRFSPSGSGKEKDYWDMRSALNFPL